MSILPDEYRPEIHDVDIPEFRGSNAWAAWNSCNGVFTCSVRNSKKEVEDIFDTYAGSGARIVPVRVFVEKEENWFYREADERERAKWL